MTRKPKPKPLKPEREDAEYRRFLETAEAAEASDDPKEFDRAFKKITKPIKSSGSQDES
jgi:hypothetical protein